ncbi:MAG: tetratricopeptide repeat protein, partial [Kordiimonadaceae bacterium]|nr:tetratricopeptide repeat protein [Kordiimonadaceae bacterium]
MKILIMIYWSFFIILLLIGSNPVNADQVADKAEFKKLYAEFSDLFANSEAIEPIIEIAEKLYSLSPLAYGKNSNNTAVVTYNLATLYDEKGGETNSEDEKRASELYKEYFTILDGQKKPLDNQYFQQYIAFVKSEHNAFGYRSDTSYSKKAIEIAKSINLSNLERANLDFLIANHRYYSGKPTDAKKLFTNAHKKYIAEYGLNHYKVGETTFWLAQIDFKNGRHKRAGENYLSAMEILSKT